MSVDAASKAGTTQVREGYRFDFFRLAAIFHGINGRVMLDAAAAPPCEVRAAKLHKLIELPSQSMEEVQ